MRLLVDVGSPWQLTTGKRNESIHHHHVINKTEYILNELIKSRTTGTQLQSVRISSEK